jgi:3',5'-cyclic AMP phosphodiesterase CpdA
MATIAHLSDVHFGAHEPKVADAAEAWLLMHRPDLLIVSGDFTQRARVAQFKLASTWLNRLRSDGFNIIAVPGNHDVPLYDVFRRFARPLARYKRYISNDLCPWFENESLAVLGINTARSLTIKDGRINRAQMDLIRERFRDVAPEKTRILVTHHPLFAMPIGKGTELTEAVGRHEDAVKAVCEAGVHIALAGHFHRTYAEAARKMVQNAGGALVIQAGTATSVRLRNNELQSFNWIETHRNSEIDLQVVAWDGERFNGASHARYSYDGENWHSRPT